MNIPDAFPTLQLPPPPPRPVVGRVVRLPRPFGAVLHPRGRLRARSAGAHCSDRRAPGRLLPASAVAAAAADRPGLRGDRARRLLTARAASPAGAGPPLRPPQRRRRGRSSLRRATGLQAEDLL